MHLSLARRLAALAPQQPELEPLAAEQYLPAAMSLFEEPEIRRAVDLFEAAAKRLRISDKAAAERYLAAAVSALTPVATPADAERLFNLKREHHRALFEQGRLDEGDEQYEALVATASDPVNLLESTRIQIYGLMNRVRGPEGMKLGLSLMAKLGLPKPDDVRPALGEGFKRVAVWARGEEKKRDFELPEISDPRVVAWTKILPETSNPSFSCDPATWAWLIMEGQRLWEVHGPSPRLLSSMGALQMLLVGTPQDYRGSYLVGRHVLAVGEARGYEPSTSFGRCMFGMAAAHWVEPIETVVDPVFRRARHDLNRIGDESFVSHTYLATDLLFDSAPTLDAAANELAEGLAFAARSSNREFWLRYQPRLQLIKSLRGQTSALGSFDNDEFNQAGHEKEVDPAGAIAAVFHVIRAMGAAIFGDTATLARHAGMAMPLMPRTPGYYLSAIGRVLQCLALCEKARALPQEERAAVLAEMEPHFKWLCARAADAPENFLHLQRWIEAERAWAFESVWAAGIAFDAAVTECLLHSRPWHRALIHERAALFHLAQGMEHSALPLMLYACETYDAWGAAGKAKELRRQHPFLRAASSARGDAAPRSTVVDAEMVRHDGRAARIPSAQLGDQPLAPHRPSGQGAGRHHRRHQRAPGDQGRRRHRRLGAGRFIGRWRHAHHRRASRRQRRLALVGVSLYRALEPGAGG